MPLYPYDCARCGPFEAWRSFAEAGEPGRCPGCRQPAPRTIAVPSIHGAAAARRARNAARAEPRLVTRPPPAPAGSAAPARRAHGGHGSPSRPWMLGH